MSTSPPENEFAAAQYREALGRYATGVAIVTCVGNGQGPVGVTVNSFTSLSLDPPLVLWSLNNKSDRGQVFLDCDTFAINVLARAQQALSVRFSESGQHDFTGIRYETLGTKAPILPGALASFDCEVEARHDGGDHTIVVGRVKDMVSREGEPLLYFRGRYRGIGRH